MIDTVLAYTTHTLYTIVIYTCIAWGAFQLIAFCYMMIKLALED